MVQWLNTPALRLAPRVLRRRMLLQPHFHAPNALAAVATLPADVRAIAFDVDNTLAAPYAREFGDAARQAVAAAQARVGVHRVLLCSNHAGSSDDSADHARAAALEAALGAPVLRHGAKKPALAVVSASCRKRNAYDKTLLI